MALIPYNVWPYAIADAVAAELYLWDREQLGVAYSYADGIGEAGPVGPEDWPQIVRLARADKLTYRDQTVRDLAARLQPASLGALQAGR
jgi:hypothetical protein